MTEEEYWYMLCTIPNIYSAQISKILGIYGTPEQFYKTEDDKLNIQNVFTPSEMQSILKYRNNEGRLDDLTKLKKNGVEFIYYTHPAFPERLKIIDDPPFSLYLKGKFPDPNKYSVGIVGSRNASGYGKDMTIKFSGNLAANGVQIISGMAIGIDAYASKGALQVGGETFVVLGTGIDVIYPKENIELYYEIIMKGGVISEFPPGTLGKPWQFPHRNRLISALSDKLLIMEARKRSGTLTTAQHALNQNVDIYALPGRITDVYSEGCNKLIADGCGVLINMEDFLFDLYSKKPFGLENSGIEYEMPGCYKMKKTKNEKTGNALEGKTSTIYNLISYSPAPIEKIIEKSRMDTCEVISIISELEILGLVEEVSTDIYSRTI